MDTDQHDPRLDPARPIRVQHPGERRSLSRSATRALDLMEHFGQVRRPLRAIEIAKALDLHPSSTNQLLKTMVDSAHLLFEAHTKTYLPSHRLALFGAWILSAYGGDERLVGLVRDVRSGPAGIVTLTTPNDLSMQILDLAGSDPTARHLTPRGLRVSMFGSAIGAAYLSILPDVEITRLATRARILQDELPGLLAEAARVREAGYADGPSNGGAIWSLAMSLPDGRFPAPLILGLAGPVDQVRPALPALRDQLRAAIDRWLSDH
jgi:DNA-binding IclR family transcriptional regulator